MNMFQPGNAVSKVNRLPHRDLFVVEWSHPGGEYTIARLLAGGLSGTDVASREKLGESELIFSDDALQFFTWAHLPMRLQDVSRPFGEMAHRIVLTLPDNPQRAIALQKLIEAKDAAVRARLFE